MEFLHKRPEEIQLSTDGIKIASFFSKLQPSSDTYNLEKFWSDLFSFVKENNELLSLAGSFRKEMREIYKITSLGIGTPLLDILTTLDLQVPFILDNLIAEILLYRGMEDNRKNLDRYTNREQTKAGMFDQSIVDKSELMFM